jgi:hypothetical protein
MLPWPAEDIMQRVRRGVFMRPRPAKVKMQGVRRGVYMRPRPAKVTMQGVRRGVYMRPRLHQVPLRGLPGAQRVGRGPCAGPSSGGAMRLGRLWQRTSWPRRRAGAALKACAAPRDGDRALGRAVAVAAAAAAAAAAWIIAGLNTAVFGQILLHLRGGVKEHRVRHCARAAREGRWGAARGRGRWTGVRQTDPHTASVF